MKPALPRINVITLIALLMGTLSSANAQSIDMSGTVSYSLVNSSTVNLKVSKIQNYRGLGSVSGTLVLQGWASKSRYSGGTIVGYKLAQVTLGRLNGGYYWANINENVSFTLPPLSQKGLFYMTMILAEYTGSGYATLDYVSMGTEILNILPPEINTSSRVSGTKNTHLSHKVNVLADSSFAVKFSASGLPPGLSINSSSGVISGTPQSFGTYNATITATNIAGTDVDVIAFDIAEGAKTPVINNSSSYNIKNEDPFTLQITATRDPYWFEAPGIPPGLNLNPDTGIISGVPNKTGTYQATFKAYNIEGIGQKNITFTVKKSAPVIKGLPLISGITGQSVDYQIEATDNPTTYNAQYLPTGLKINITTGLITGRPTESGMFVVKIWAQNNVGLSNKNIQVIILDSSEIKQADLKATSTSFAMQATTFKDPLGNDYMYYFTTYDGNRDRSPFMVYLGDGTPQNSNILISQEARLVSGTQYSYEFDYILHSLGDNTVSYGDIVANIPSNDFNSDGLPDFLDIDTKVNLNVGGKLYNDDPFIIDNFAGVMTRNTGEHWGNYTINTVNGEASGNWMIAVLTGNIKYQTTAKNYMTIEGYQKGNGNSLSIIEANTTYEIINKDQIRLPDITFSVQEEGQPVETATTGTAILNRTNNKYIGKLILEDGASETSWPDYTQFVLVITDTNDSDQDGVPDLSDIQADEPIFSKPSIIEQPQSVTVDDGSQLKLQVAVIGQNLKYQWFKNGAKIDGATESDYLVLEAHTEDAGDYYAVITNPSGEAISGTALVQVLDPQEDPPTIVIQPQGATVKKGLPVELNVKANGENLNYQWFKDGSIVDRASESTYLIFAADSVDTGAYFVKITNPGGEVVSDTVVVQVVVEIVTAFTKVVRSAGEVAFKYKISPPHYYQIQSASTPNFTGYEVLAQRNSTGFFENIVVQNDYSEGARFFRIALTEPKYEKPTIVTEPTSKTVESGNAAIFQVVVQSDTEASYKWFKNGEVIVGQIDSSLIIPVASVGDAGDYTVEVTNEGGSIVSGVANLDVKAGEGPPVITQQPTRLLLTRNQSGTLSVEVTGTKPFEYQWYKYETKIDGATQNIYRIKNADPSQHSGFYKVEIKNKYGSVFSERVLVFVEG